MLNIYVIKPESAGLPSLLRVESFALPRQSVSDDLQIVQMRLPSEPGTDAVASRDDVCRIARTAAGELDLEIDAGDPFHRLDHFQHRKATPVTAIERRRAAARAQIGERIAMRGNEIGNVNVIADAGAVRLA